MPNNPNPISEELCHKTKQIANELCQEAKNLVTKGTLAPNEEYLLQALASMMAKVQIAHQVNINSSLRRLFKQYFPYLFEPLPMMGIVQLDPQKDRYTIAKNTELTIQPLNAPKQAVYFQTTRELSLYPFQLERAGIQNQNGQRFLELSFLSPSNQKYDISSLPLYIHHNGDYNLALLLQYNLYKNKQKAEIFWNDSSQGMLCEVSFGSFSSVPESIGNQSIRNIRSFFHFPYQELYMTFIIKPGPKTWKSFRIRLYLQTWFNDGQWPQGLQINKDTFKLFTVPVINLQETRSARLEQIEKTDRYKVVHPNGTQNSVFHSLHSIKVNGKTLLSAIIPGENTYQIDYDLDRKTNEAPIILKTQENFPQQSLVAEKVSWYQPNAYSWMTQPEEKRLMMQGRDTPFTMLAQQDARTVPSALFSVEEKFLPLFFSLNKFSSSARNLGPDDIKGFLVFLDTIGLQNEFMALSQNIQSFSLEREEKGILHYKITFSHQTTNTHFLEAFIRQVERFLNSFQRENQFSLIVR